MIRRINAVSVIAEKRHPAPIEPESFSMPVNHCVGFDNNEHSLPSRPESEEGDPESAIEWRDLGFGFLLAESGQLLPEGQLYNCLFFSTSEKGRSGVDDEFQEVE
jgi:hypothetical protein